MDTRLNAARRERELAEARRTVADLLVIGLGATGAGAALDAASRGLSVVAIDAHDIAFGTSRWSSKLIHGGLRYLARGQVGVAWESAVERGRLLRRIAPHLVAAHPYLLPLTPAVSRAQEAAVLAGYRLGDALRAAAGAGLLDPADERVLADAWRFASRIRDAIMLVRGRPSDSIPTGVKERAMIARALGYPPDGSEEFVDDYRRITRRARQVMERIFYEG